MIDLNRFDENNIVKTIQIDSDGFCKEFPGGNNENSGSGEIDNNDSGSSQSTSEPKDLLGLFYSSVNIDDYEVGNIITICIRRGSEIADINPKAKKIFIGFNQLNTENASDYTIGDAIDNDFVTAHNLHEDYIDMSVVYGNDDIYTTIMIDGETYDQTYYELNLMALSQAEYVAIVHDPEDITKYHYECDVTIFLTQPDDNDVSVVRIAAVEVLHIVTPEMKTNTSL